MKRIYKYPVPVNDQVVLELAKGAKILTLQIQRGEPYIWALVDTDNPKEERCFYIYGTGMEVREGLNYIGTFQMLGGNLVWHLFE